MKFMQVAFWSILRVHTSSSDMFKRSLQMPALKQILVWTCSIWHCLLGNLKNSDLRVHCMAVAVLRTGAGWHRGSANFQTLMHSCLLHDSVCTAPQPNGMKIHKLKQLPAGPPSTSLPKTDQHQLGKTAWSTWTSTEHSHNSYYTYFSLRALGCLQWIVGELAAGTKRLSVRTCPLTTTAQHLPSGDRSVNNHT